MVVISHNGINCFVDFDRDAIRKSCDIMYLLWTERFQKQIVAVILAMNQRDYRTFVNLVVTNNTQIRSILLKKDVVVRELAQHAAEHIWVSLYGFRQNVRRKHIVALEQAGKGDTLKRFFNHSCMRLKRFCAVPENP